MRSGSPYKPNSRALSGRLDPFIFLAVLLIWFPQALFAAGPGFGIQDHFSPSYVAPAPRFSALFTRPKNEQAALQASHHRYPGPQLEKIDFSINSKNQIIVPNFPDFNTLFTGKFAASGKNDEYVFFSINPTLQKQAEEIVKKARAPHIAAVIMETRTGRILAIAEKSVSIKKPALHASFPAASIFKIVTSAAALEQTSLHPNSSIKYRGSNYTLNKWNYRPDRRKDNRSMNFGEALGRSCNPVFARVALNHLDPEIIKKYARSFGFNSDIQFDTPLYESSANIPYSDYELSRTAAGFGKVTLSPVHAAALMSAIANNGLLPRPSFVDQVVRPNGIASYNFKPEYLRRVVMPKTSRELLRMLHNTTTVGTSKSEFQSRRGPLLPGIRVAAKTGTLRGKNPRGLNKWFIAAAPIERPEIALAVIVVNPVNINARASRIGRQLLDKYFNKGRKYLS